MPSTYATDANMGYTPDITSGTVTCQVSYINNTAVTARNAASSALDDLDPNFIHVDCDIGGQLKFTTEGVNQGVIQLLHTIDSTPLNSVISDTSNVRDKNGTDIPGKNLHMEILRDMYESTTTTTRPSESAITASFTDTSITTFQTTLYQAIKDSINEYVTSRVMFAGSSFQPILYAKTDGTMHYGDTASYNNTFSIVDGEQHGRMFLLNVLNSCSTSISPHVSNTSNPTKSLIDVMGDGYMLLGLTLTTTGGFHNTHTKYAVGLRIV